MSDNKEMTREDFINNLAIAMDQAGEDLKRIMYHLRELISKIKEETEKEAGFGKAGELLKRLETITEIQNWILENCETYNIKTENYGSKNSN